MIKRTLLFENPVYLSLRNEQLIIRLPEIEKNNNLPLAFKQKAFEPVPIEDIGLLVLDNKQITITQGVCEKLMYHNVVMLWCDSCHLPQALTLPMTENDTFSEKLRYQLEASEPLKKQLWKQTIETKILNQAKYLEQRGFENKHLMQMYKKVGSGDPDNVEGQAAARYWGYLLANYYTTRGREEAPPNNMLNYGYAILRACVARSLVASGCLAALGIHHRNKYNAYCLADDIMEPYRVYVDRAVFNFIDEHGLPNETLQQVHKKAMLEVLSHDVLIDGRTSPLMIATQRTSASLMRCFMGETRKILYPVFQ